MRNEEPRKNKEQMKSTKGPMKILEVIYGLDFMLRNDEE